MRMEAHDGIVPALAILAGGLLGLVQFAIFFSDLPGAPALAPRVVAAASLAAVSGLALGRLRPGAWLALSLLAVFVFATRVHERYIYYALPFLVVIAVTFRAWIPVLAALLLVGTFEMTWFLWLAPANAAPDEPAQSAGAAAWSLLLAVLTVASFVYACAALLRRPRPALTRS